LGHRLDQRHVLELPAGTYDKLLLMVWHPAEQPVALRLRMRRDGVITQLIKRILVWAVIPVLEMPASWSTHQVVGRAHGGVTGICSRESNHSVDIFLNVLNKSFDNVYLLRTCFNQLLDGVIDLFLILAGVA